MHTRGCFILLSKGKQTLFIKECKDSYCVPDASTAIKVAEALWVPVYGKDLVESEKPFWAKLINGVWHVGGTLRTEFGGTVSAEIRKKDCQVLRITHYK